MKMMVITIRAVISFTIPYHTTLYTFHSASLPANLFSRGNLHTRLIMSLILLCVLFRFLYSISLSLPGG